jgi:hypothetical protein
MSKLDGFYSTTIAGNDNIDIEKLRRMGFRMSKRKM